jgi:4-amino-4-deoxy-L-arabinose transferase-like glycosyltransferase
VPAPSRPLPDSRRLSWPGTRVFRSERTALVGLLAAAAVLDLWDLAASGWANPFYAAAVEAGVKRPSAAFFGSLDAAGFMSVDKPPFALWVMEVPVRFLGFNSWTLLVPEALAGVATVAFVRAAVRRSAGAVAGLVAGAVVALTPVAALMFRFDNPDAVLVLLLSAGAYGVVRAVDEGRTRWWVFTAACVGTAFLTKMFEAFLVVPAFGLVLLVAAPGSLRRRLLQLSAAAAVLAATSLWWVVAVMAVPAADRPWVDSTSDDSLWTLIFGYNGLGRVDGGEAGATTNHWGPTGVLRMFSTGFGGGISWLLPAGAILLVVGLLTCRHVGRRDRTRAAYLLWGGWLVVAWITFSLGQGIILDYYTCVMAPPLSALVGIGVSRLRIRDDPRRAPVLGAVLVAGTTVWAVVVLRWTPSWYPWLAPAVAIAGGMATVILVGAGAERRDGRRRFRRLVPLAVIAAVVGTMSGPAAYTAETVATPEVGGIPSPGPPLPGTGPPQSSDQDPLDADARAALRDDARRYWWVAAVLGGDNTGSLELATSESVMDVGGFNASDPVPTLPEFRADVARHRIHYFVAGTSGNGWVGSVLAPQDRYTTGVLIYGWVVTHFRAEDIGGVTLYDLDPGHQRDQRTSLIGGRAVLLASPVRADQVGVGEDAVGSPSFERRTVVILSTIKRLASRSPLLRDGVMSRRSRRLNPSAKPHVRDPALPVLHRLVEDCRRHTFGSLCAIGSGWSRTSAISSSRCVEQGWSSPRITRIQRRASASSTVPARSMASMSAQSFRRLNIVLNTVRSVGEITGSGSPSKVTTRVRDATTLWNSCWGKKRSTGRSCPQ